MKNENTMKDIRVRSKFLIFHLVGVPSFSVFFVCMTPVTCGPIDRKSHYLILYALEYLSLAYLMSHCHFGSFDHPNPGSLYKSSLAPLLQTLGIVGYVRVQESTRMYLIIMRSKI